MNDTEPIHVRVTESSSTWFPHASSLLYLIPIFLIYRAVLGKSSSLQKNVPKHWAADHWPLIGSSLRFFARRQDMMLAGKHLFPTGYFSFFVGAKHVVALSGAEGRQTFFGNKDLSLSQGYFLPFL
jgi:sterol 14-demethylase